MKPTHQTDEDIARTLAMFGGCSADVNAGTDVTLIATPPSGGSFTSWSGCKSTSGARLRRRRPSG